MKTIDEAAQEYFSKIEGFHNKAGVDKSWIDAFKAGSEFAIDELASKFEQLKQSATTLRDVVYLDGVLTVIESMKIENNITTY